MRRIKKVLKFAAIGLGAMIALALIANALWIFFSGRAVEQRLAALRAEGQPLSIADLAPPSIPPETNAATYLRRAKDQLDAVQKEAILPIYDTYGDNDRLLAPEDAAKLQSVFDAYPKVIPLLEQAAACQSYASPMDFTLSADPFSRNQLEGLDVIRTACRVLMYHSLWLQSAGKHDEALHDCLTILKLSHHFEREPTIVHYLVCCAISSVAVQQANLVLQSGELTAESRRALDEELAKHDTGAALKHALQTERAFGLSHFNDVIPWSQHWISRGFGNREVSYYLDFMGREITAADQPYWKYSRQPVSQVHVLTNLLIPAMQATRTAEARDRARLRSLRVLNALQALPESEQAQVQLSDLKLPPEATVDPFTGKALIARKLPAGWLVYSIGMNLQDDGGKLADDADPGVGPLPPPGELKKTADDDADEQE